MKEEKLPRFLSEKTVCDITNMSPTTLDREIKAGNFPSPYKLSARKKGWLESEVLGWVNRIKKQKEEL